VRMGKDGWRGRRFPVPVAPIPPKGSGSSHRPPATSWIVPVPTNQTLVWSSAEETPLVFVEVLRNLSQIR